MEASISDRVATLRRFITDEIFIAMGFRPNGWQRKLLWPVFWPPAHQFSKLIAKADSDIRSLGISRAAQLLVSRFIRSVEVRGLQNVPKDGALLVASNHPGAFDGVLLIANLQRDDLAIVVSGIPFLKGLEAARRHLIYTTHHSHDRTNALRASIRHLDSGGSLLIFPSGLVDPDPAFMPGASDALGSWSRSLELMLRKSPGAKLLIAIVSGVLAPACFRNPLTRLLRERWKRQKLAEFLQIMQQMFLPHSFGLTPRVTFGKPLSQADLGTRSQPKDIQFHIIEQARAVLAAHTGASQETVAKPVA